MTAMPGQSPEKKTGLTAVKEIISSQLNCLAGPGIQQTRNLKEAWPRIMGPAIAAHSQILYIKNNVLYIGVKSAAWHSELKLMQDKILKKINEKNETLNLKEVRFKMC